MTTTKPTAPSAVEAETILRALDRHCTERPNHQLYTWVDNNCKETNKLTYKDLDEVSSAVAALLLKMGCKKGDRVMIAYPFGLEFLAGLFGCMKVGVIGCSIYPPNPTKNVKAEMAKFRGYVEDAGAKIALSSKSFATAMKAVSLLYKSNVKWVGTDNLPKASKAKNAKILQTASSITSNDVAFIQYTSGSTGSPKGVVIPHSALVENFKALTPLVEAIPGKTTLVLWLPQYHDMGLVAGFMESLFAGMQLIMASPLDFISKPLLWTDMVEKYKADLTCAPNFAYALLFKRLRQAGRTADWSHVSCAMAGAEPTQPETVESIIGTLGVKPEHVFQSYGLAESVVFLTGGIAETSNDGLVSCGPAITSTLQLRIVKDGQVLPDGEIGTIWAQSPRVASGYYGKEELTKSAFENTLPGEEGHWLNTGDMGKVVSGTLFVTGRVKDVIIVNGKNHFPTDIELSIEDEFHDIIRPGRSAAFQMANDTIGVIVEARKPKEVTASKVDVMISRHVLDVHGLVTEKVLVMMPDSIPKTTSGKLKRSEIRSRTNEGSWNDKSVLLSYVRGETSVLADSKSSHNPGSQVLTNGSLSNSTADVKSPKASTESPPDFEGKAGTTIQASQGHLEAILKDVLMGSPVMDLTWSDNGLASVKAAELMSRVQQVFCVDLPPNFTTHYTTPRELEAFLFTTTEASFEVVDYTDPDTAPTLSKLVLLSLQGLGIIALLLVLALSFLPAFFLGREISKLAIEFEIGSSGRYAVWNFLPFVVPAFFITFSFFVVCLKRLLIGRYKAGAYQLHTWQYLCWWFMDRLLEMWESFVGRFLLQTKLLWFIYRLMGAQISPSVEVNAFVCEFDLVSVGPGSKLEHKLRCRKFRSWDITQESPVMVLRPVTIGNNCVVSGMIGPGSKVGNGCKVESLSAVAEGSILPDGVTARGSPAYNAGKAEITEHQVPSWQWQLETLKLIWMIMELYLYFGLFLAAQVIMNQQLPSVWKYTPLLYWFLVLALTALSAVLMSIVLKWALIGKQKAGQHQKNSLWSEATKWVCDYHFRLCLLTLMPFSGMSKFWILVLKMHGLDIDFSSVINGPYCYEPSKVDLIKIKNSFLSVPSFDLDTTKGMIEIVDSNIGYNAQICSDVKVVRSSIPPMSVVRESVYDLNQNFYEGSACRGIVNAFINELSQVVLNGLIFLAFIPSYEVFVNIVYGASTGIAILGIWAALMTHIVAAHVLLWLVEHTVLNSPTFFLEATIGVYINHAWANRAWNFWNLLHGTALFPYWLWLMGAPRDNDQVNKDVWYFGNSLHDIKKVHFVGRVIVDDSHLAGHMVVANNVTMADTYIRGLVQPGSYAYAGASLINREHVAFKVFHAAAAMGKDGTVSSPAAYHEGKTTMFQDGTSFLSRGQLKEETTSDSSQEIRAI